MASYAIRLCTLSVHRLLVLACLKQDGARTPRADEWPKSLAPLSQSFYSGLNFGFYLERIRMLKILYRGVLQSILVLRW